MWSRMMSRGLLYSTVIIGVDFWLLTVITEAVAVSWNDLESGLRAKIMAVDFAGTSMLIVSTLWIL